MVAEHAHHIAGEAQFGQAGVAGGQAVTVEEDHPGRAFLRGVVEVDLGTLAQGSRRGLEALQAHQPAAGGEKGVGTAEGVAAMDVRHFQALHVDGAALAGADHLHAAAVALQAAGAGGQGAGHEAEFVPFADRAGNDRARDDRAVPLEGEHAVHRQAEDVGAVPGRQAAGAG